MKNYIIFALIALVMGYIGAQMTGDKTVTQIDKKETAFDRVMRTGVLRCGYATWPPNVMKDPNTGKVSGIIPELVEYAAKSVNLKVDWVQEVSWATYREDLKNGRYDAMCAGAWAVKEGANLVAYTRPLFYNPVYAYVRVEDTRFDNGLDILNDPQYKLAGVDGGMSSVIAVNDFPKAKLNDFPQMSEPSTVLMDVMYGKSDITFIEGSLFMEFEKYNPNKLRPVSWTPYRSFATPLMATSIEDIRLATMFDTIVGEMQLHGIVDRVLKKYEADERVYLKPATPYQINDNSK
jgi:ABC-type amino acid transport substrate-binding protein